MIYWICFNSVIWLQKTWNIAQVALDAYVVPLYYFLSLGLIIAQKRASSSIQIVVKNIRFQQKY